MDSFLSDLSAALVPGLITLFGTVLTILINRASAVARERWGIEVEARHREALHAAIMSGIQSALSRGLTGRAVIGAAMEHASVSVPDAIRKLTPGPGVLQAIAEAKLNEVLTKGAGVDPRIYAPGGGALVMGTIERALQGGSNPEKDMPK